MTIIKKKIGVIALVICCILFAATVFITTQIKAPTAVCAEENAITTMSSKPSGLNSTDIVATIEDELQQQGTSILEVLQRRRNTYLEELNTALNDEQGIIIAIIDTLDKSIAEFEVKSDISRNQFSLAVNNADNTRSGVVSPNCTCNAGNIITGTLCANCIEYQDTYKAVAAIGAGFDARGWSLAADLIWFNLSNTELDVDYWPTRGGQIVDAPQIAQELAYNNGLAAAFSQESPGRLNGLFDSTIEGDTYNSLGSFYYSKTDAGGGNVNIDIIDRYDWAKSKDGGSASVFNDTLAKAQELGIVIPFYTRINITIPGYVPYIWEYTDEGVEIKGVADDITTAEFSTEIKDMRIKPRDGIDQPEVNVTSIGENAFANNTNLISINLQDTVTTIKNSAFKDCSNLLSVSNLNAITYIGDSAFKNCISIKTLDNLDKLEYIGSEAFSKCEALTSIRLPSLSYLGRKAFADSFNLQAVSFANNTALVTISERAFSNTGLSNFTIPVNVGNIEDEAFLDTTITSFEGNSNYSWQNELLIKCNVTNKDKKIAVYVNPTVSNISFPNDVAIIYSKLFKDNANISTVYLNQVEHIGPEAFRNSSVTQIFNSNNIVDCDITALLNTPWYKNSQSDFIILGKVLLKYTGTESIVKIPNYVYRIGAACFENGVTTQLVLSEQINSIGFASFIGLKSLESIVFTSDIPPMLDGYCFSDNITLYVKEGRLTEYENNISFVNLPNTITKKEIIINYHDVNNNLIGSEIEYYGSKLDNCIDAPIIKGKDFFGWKHDGKDLKINDMIEYYDNLDLYAVYSIAKYQISIIGEDGEKNLIIEYGQEINLPIPSENGKTFKGWFDQPVGGNLIINTTGKCVWERTIDNDTLYPQYNLINYTITYHYNNADKSFHMPNDFTVDNPVTKTELLSPQKFGYVFKKWNYNNQVFTSTSGIFDNIVLVAEWEGKIVGDSSSLNINDSVIIVDMTSGSSNINYAFTIAPSVKSITFVGDYTKKYNLNVKINNRIGALILGLKNMNIKASTENSKNAIDCESDVMIYLTYYGENKISGDDGANAYGDGKDGGDGGYGIYVHSLSLMAYDEFSNISIHGGNGGNGSDGAAGKNGSNGNRGPSGSIFKPVKGENGSNGSGGNIGGNGGKGGYAIYAISLSVKVSNDSNYSIQGGNGGDGGDGGKGGNGGKGADDTSADIFTGVGKPGDGGNGGDGGSNGIAGQGSLGINYEILYSTSGENGSDGNIGIAGAAGSGGSHGTVGDDGADGIDGKGGNDGDVNIGIVSDKIAAEQSQSSAALVNLPYAFSTEFFNMYLS